MTTNKTAAAAYEIINIFLIHQKMFFLFLFSRNFFAFLCFSQIFLSPHEWNGAKQEAFYTILSLTHTQHKQNLRIISSLGCFYFTYIHEEKGKPRERERERRIQTSGCVNFMCAVGIFKGVCCR